MKSVFCINDYIGVGNTVCMHCNSQEKADEFYRYLRKEAPMRIRSLENKWVIYGEDTVYFFAKNTYGSVHYATNIIHSKVLEFDDYFFSSGEDWCCDDDDLSILF